MKVNSLTIVVCFVNAGKEANLPQNWPQSGRIQFDNVSVRYDSMQDAVLRKITFEILPGEKVGIFVSVAQRLYSLL